MNNKKVFYICIKTAYNLIGFFALWILTGFMLVGMVNAATEVIYEVSYIDYAYTALMGAILIIATYCLIAPDKRERKHGKKIHKYICVCSILGITLVEIPLLSKTVAMILSDIDKLTRWGIFMLLFLIAYRILLEVYSAHPNWLYDSSDGFIEKTEGQ